MPDNENPSRVEQILNVTLGRETDLPQPNSRVEGLLIDLKEAIEEGGGGGEYLPLAGGTMTGKIEFGDQLHYIENANNAFAFLKGGQYTTGYTIDNNGATTRADGHYNYGQTVVSSTGVVNTASSQQGVVTETLNNSGYSVTTTSAIPVNISTANGAITINSANAGITLSTTTGGSSIALQTFSLILEGKAQVNLKNTLGTAITVERKVESTDESTSTFTNVDSGNFGGNLDNEIVPITESEFEALETKTARYYFVYADPEEEPTASTNSVSNLASVQSLDTLEPSDVGISEMTDEPSYVDKWLLGEDEEEM